MRLSYDIQWSRQFERINWEISGLTKTALYAPFVTCEDLSTKYGEDLSTKCGEDLSIEYGEDLSTNYCEDLSTKYSQNSTRGPGPDIQKPLKVVVQWRITQVERKNFEQWLRLKILKHVAHFCFEKIKIHVHINFSALLAVGGDVEIFRTKFLGGDLDEKIDFRRITSRAPWYFKRKFLGAILTKISIFKV